MRWEGLGSSVVLEGAKSRGGSGSPAGRRVTHLLLTNEDYNRAVSVHWSWGQSLAVMLVPRWEEAGYRMHPGDRESGDWSSSSGRQLTHLFF